MQIDREMVETITTKMVMEMETTALLMSAHHGPKTHKEIMVKMVEWLETAIKSRSLTMPTRKMLTTLHQINNRTTVNCLNQRKMEEKRLTSHLPSPAVIARNGTGHGNVLLRSKSSRLQRMLRDRRKSPLQMHRILPMCLQAFN